MFLMFNCYFSRRDDSIGGSHVATVVPWHSVERPCPLMGKADDMALPDFGANSQHLPLGALSLRVLIIRGPHPEHLMSPSRARILV